MTGGAIYIRFLVFAFRILFFVILIPNQIINALSGAAGYSWLRRSWTKIMALCGLVLGAAPHQKGGSPFWFLLGLDLLLLIYRAVRGLFENRASTRVLTYLENAQDLSHRERGRLFERMVRDAYRRRGFEADLVEDLKSQGRLNIAGQDNGADVLAKHRHTREELVIQCKLYKGSVGNDAVQEVCAARGFYGGRGVVVTQSRRGYTRAAVQLARANQVELVERVMLLRWLSED